MAKKQKPKQKPAPEPAAPVVPPVVAPVVTPTKAAVADGALAVLEVNNVQTVTAIPHRRQRILRIGDVEWSHKTEDAQGRWVYRTD